MEVRLKTLIKVLSAVILFGCSQGTPTNGLFEQKLDHFNSGSEIFGQRYWQTWFNFGSRRDSRSQFLNVTGVAFLMISGESADTSPMQGAWMDFASRFAGMGVEVACFELEHRYYGNSLPRSARLEFLSSDQALEDIRQFVTRMSSMYQLTKFKWVVFGGSYAGSLAAWARQQYPGLIHAAVASSAPVEAKADLEDYLEIVRQSLASVQDPACPSIIPKLARQQPYLITDVEYLVQYGFQENACRLASCFANTGDYQSCRKQWNHARLNPKHSSREFDNSRYSSVFVKRGFHGTAWQYQQCTEFGWFPTSGRDSSLFGSLYPLSSFVYYTCQNDYDTLQRGISHVNSIHGGKRFTADRVFFVHGSLDPYVVAGVTSSKPRTPVHVIFGGSHCLDMDRIEDISMRYQNPAQVKEVEHAQELTMKYLLEWLQE